MIENNYIELGKRAVACNGWRWMPGMLTIDGERVLGVTLEGALHLCDPNYDSGEHTPPRVFHDTSGSLLPDFEDSATLGCLLMLVREVRKQPTYLPTCLDSIDEAWVINPPCPWRQTRYHSMVSVLVAALEAKS